MIQQFGQKPTIDRLGATPLCFSILFLCLPVSSAVSHVHDGNTPIPHYDNFLEKVLKSGKTCVGVPPPPPPRLFQGWRSSSEPFCPP